MPSIDEGPVTGVDPHRWLRTFPSTQGTVAVGLGLAVFYVVVALVGDLMSHPLSDVTHLAIATFLSALIGVNFAVKRFSDIDYAAAKVSGAAPIVAATPSPITVTAPASVTVGDSTP